MAWRVRAFGAGTSSVDSCSPAKNPLLNWPQAAVASNPLADLRDRAGRLLPLGIYSCRLTAGANVAVKKMVVVP